MATLQQLQVIDGFQGWRGDMNAAAITDLAKVELAELAVAEAGLRRAGTRQTNAVHAYMLIDVIRHRMRISTLEDPAFFIQQSFHHPALGCFYSWPALGGRLGRYCADREY